MSEKELVCYQCKKVPTTGPGNKGRMKGKRFQCKDCADKEDRAKNEKEKKKQWDAERKKEKDHLKNAPENCSCPLCKDHRKGKI